MCRQNLERSPATRVIAMYFALIRMSMHLISCVSRTQKHRVSAKYSLRCNSFLIIFRSFEKISRNKRELSCEDCAHEIQRSLS